MTNPRHRGFTLIELMIVVAIIGVLAAIALPAYQRYVDDSNGAKIQGQYESAVRFTENEVRRLYAEVATGGVPNLAAADASGDYTQAGYLAGLNAEGGRAAGGGPAYTAIVDDALGSVGVTVTGTLAGLDWQVVLTRPLYGPFAGLPVQTHTVTQN